MYITKADPANSNSEISNSLLFRTPNHFPWICSSVIHYWPFRTPAISIPLRVQNTGVQLYMFSIVVIYWAIKPQFLATLVL